MPLLPFPRSRAHVFACLMTEASSLISESLEQATQADLLRVSSRVPPHERLRDA